MRNGYKFIGWYYEDNYKTKLLENAFGSAVSGAGPALIDGLNIQPHYLTNEGRFCIMGSGRKLYTIYAKWEKDTSDDVVIVNPKTGNPWIPIVGILAIVSVFTFCLIYNKKQKAIF